MVDSARRRRAVLVTILVAVGGGVWLYLFPPLPDEPRITISTETTYITEPLDADGFPDYLAAINDRFGEGVESKENAAVLLLQAYGPNEIPERFRQTLYTQLGMQPLPERGEYFVGELNFANRLRKQGIKLPDGYSPIRSLWPGGPWKRADQPSLAKWLDANATPMRLTMEASRRPKLYIPLIIDGVNDGNEAFSSSIAVSAPIMDAARLLYARAMQDIGEGRLDAARETATALHRLSRFWANSCGEFGHNMARVVDNMAHGINRVLIAYGQVTSKQALAYQAKLYSLKAFPRPDEPYDFTERYGVLQVSWTVQSLKSA